MPKTYIVTNIKYDTDGDVSIAESLPKTLSITVNDEEEDVQEYISDEISNITGFCHMGFSTKPEIE